MRMYTVFACFVVDGKLISIKEYACWSMLEHTRYIDTEIGNKGYKFLKDNHVYIAKYVYPETKQYIDLIVSTINEITPCEITDEITDEKLIKFKLMETYDQSLIMLNFIRNLWHEPNGSNGYCIKFFELLKKSQQKDPLERLTWANKEACKNLIYGGHSNVYPGSKLKIKNTKSLLEYKGNSVFDFLST